MDRTEIPLEARVDNTNGWTSSGRGHGYRNRSIYLRFEYSSTPSARPTYSLVSAQGDALQRLLPLGPGMAEGELHTDAPSLHEAIVEVQNAWRDHVILRQETLPDGEQWFPFASNWDLSTDERAENRLREVARPLAEAGYKLFQLLFLVGDPLLREVGEALTSILHDGRHVITVQSDSLFVPWWMLYTPPPGYENFDTDEDMPVPWEGFWGYSHLVEHNFKRAPARKPCITIDGAGITAGVNVDRNLDETFPETPCVAPVISMFQSTTAATIVRESKRRLAGDIKSPNYGDHIMYFGCHGIGVSSVVEPSQAHVRLTDMQAIRSTDFKVWLNQTPLHTTPIVFINACQGGQMSSLFYTAFGNELISRGANSLIGSQIDIPPAFAVEYAKAFFMEFGSSQATRSGDTGPVRAGDVFHRIANMGVTQNRNPLGLTMSLYRGIDSHFCTTSVD
jgi:hypothetical protein